VAKKKIRAGIVGAGFAATFHFEAIQRVHGVEVELAGVFAPTAERREAFAARRGVGSYASLDALLDRCDLIHVCAPVAVHEATAVHALKRGIHPIVEKPITGFCGDGSPGFRGDRYPKEQARAAVYASLERLLEAEQASRARILYAENWVYAPAIQKEREIIEKTGAQLLWLRGEESHSGSHSTTYGYWRHSGGGVMLGKGCHPLTAALYLKRKEGHARGVGPIRPRSVSARIHTLTGLPSFMDKGHLRKDYHDIDDYSTMHVEFQDGTVADIVASDIVQGGIHNWLEVAANNHRTICNLNPTNMLQTYNPVDEYLRDVYVVEKTGTKQGWSNPSPDEDFLNGFPQEMEAFYRAAAYGEPLESDSSLAADAISTIFSGYLSAERQGAAVEIRNF
jgi:predicted dehydrogenase